MLDFMTSQEKNIKFYKTEDKDGWTDPNPVLIFETKGIAAFSSFTLTGSESTKKIANGVRIFLKISDRENAQQLVQGDYCEIMGNTYVIAGIPDTRGVLPGKYKIRIEGIAS